MTDVDQLSPLKRALIEIRELKARVAASERRMQQPIAIVGAGLRFPGGVHDLASYWDLLRDGVDAITEVPPDRWAVDELYDSDPDAAGRVVTRRGGFLDGIDRFDAAFFSMSPREAESLDPQQRLVLELVWEALEDANIPPHGLFGSSLGVYIGVGHSDYLRMLLAEPELIDTYTTTGSALSIAAGRVSYLLGTHGPAIAVDTACSSSLVAVHLAVRALRSGECDMAIAGGVNVMLTPELTINFSKSRMMAPDGRCKTFDATADGYVRSEGCGMVVLKRIDDALRDEDRIIAVIKGSAINQDGRSSGITAPNGPAQEAVIRDALADARVAPTDVGYVETHGTGTVLGDPIEVGALAATLGPGRPPDQPLLLGSVKTNIGHTETAAGIAGMLKAALVVQRGEIPPHLHLRELNPHIAADDPPIAVPTLATPWPKADAPRVAGVSSFGFSGTNAHVVLAEAPSPPQLDRDIEVPPTPNLVAISARTPAALVETAQRTAAALRSQPDASLAAVARSINLGRSHLDVRRGLVAASVDELITDLDAITLDGVVTSAPVGHSGVAFLFSGHGSYAPRVGRQLYTDEPAFAAAIDRCESLLAGVLDRPLTDLLFGAVADDPTSMTVAQPALFALQHALVELWASWGICPSMVAGHSAGEYVAAVTAGVLDLADGLRLIAERGRLMDTLEPGGAMAAVFLDESTVADALAGRGDDVGIAAVNGPFTTVIAGRAVAVEAVIESLGLADDDVRRLPIPVAAHSPLVEPILDRFAVAVEGVSLRRPSVGLVSSMTGRFVSDEITRPEYWRDHLRAPVRFAAVIDTMREAGCSAFVEIGPGSTLIDLGRRSWPDDSATWVASLRRDTDEQRTVLTGLAQLHERGIDVDWAALALHPGRRAVGRPVRLPSYPWQRRRAWAQAAEQRRVVASAAMWPAAVAAARRQADQGPLDLDAGTYPERWATMDELAAVAIERTLVELGRFTTSGEAHTADELVAPDGFASVYRHLAARWLGHLAALGRLRRDGDRYIADAALVAADLDPIIERLRRSCATIEPLVDYIARCCERLTDVVSGQEQALVTLFPDGGYETVDFLYADWPVQRYFNGIVAAAVAAAATTRAGRGIRVIEVGAGTGGTTASVLAALPPGSTYVFTDVSEFFLTRAAERFDEYAGVSYRLLDIEHHPADQGCAPGSADVVVAANVLHATSDLDATLAHVRSLLAPGGMLVLYESTSHPRWFDVTTGLIEGWQRFGDSWRDDVPLIDTTTWRTALVAAGFDAVDIVPRPDAPTNHLLQHVLLAREPGAESPARPGVDGAHADARPDIRVVQPDLVRERLAGVRQRLAGATEDERADVIVGAVRDAVGSVLRIPEPEQLRRDQPLLDLGFDSLMAVELRNVLQEALALDGKLPATLLFDHPTIHAIALHLDGLARDRRDGDLPTSASGTDHPPTTDPGRFHRLDEDAVAAMTDEEAEAMLLDRLQELEP